MHIEARSIFQSIATMPAMVLPFAGAGCDPTIDRFAVERSSPWEGAIKKLSELEADTQWDDDNPAPRAQAVRDARQWAAANLRDKVATGCFVAVSVGGTGEVDVSVYDRRNNSRVDYSFDGGGTKTMFAFRNGELTEVADLP